MQNLKEKVYRTELRFKNKKQKNDFKRIAKTNRRSMNAELQNIISIHIAHEQMTKEELQEKADKINYDGLKVHPINNI